MWLYPDCIFSLPPSIPPPSTCTAMTAKLCYIVSSSLRYCTIALFITHTKAKKIATRYNYLTGIQTDIERPIAIDGGLGRSSTSIVIAVALSNVIALSRHHNRSIAPMSSHFFVGCEKKSHFEHFFFNLWSTYSKITIFLIGQRCIAY